MTVIVPIVTLDVASTETETIDNGLGGTAVVNKSVKWVKKASNAPLSFHFATG